MADERSEPVSGGRAAVNQTRPERGARGKRIVLLVMAIAILVPSMLGFAAKFLEFIHTFRGTADGAFAITPMLNYLFATGGFFCMLIWATANGMFRNVEEPKFHMLELEERLTAAEQSSSREAHHVGY